MHFTVLVASKADPRGNRNVVDALLAPYDEDPKDDRFLIKIDITEEARSDYQDFLKHADPSRSFDDWLDAEYGSGVELDEETGRVLRETAANPKWDWYQIGGRWSGLLKAKDMSMATINTPGVGGDDAPPRTGYADILQKGNLDLDGMANDVRNKAVEAWGFVRTLIHDRPEFLLRMEIAFELPTNDPVRIAFLASPTWDQLAKRFGPYDVRALVIDILGLGVEDYAARCAHNARFCTHSTLVEDDNGGSTWLDHDNNDGDVMTFDEVLAAIPDDYWLTLVDCHT